MRFIVAFTVALLAAFALPAPAQAAQFGSLCYWKLDGDRIPKLYCVDIQVALPWEKFTKCWMCGLAIRWKHDKELPMATEVQVGQHIAEGLQKLGAAAHAGDSARLRSTAIESFTAAARLSRTERLFALQTGVADPAKNTFNPQPDPPGIPWLKAGAIDVADGVALLQRSFADPANAAHYQKAAMAEFDAAYKELSDQVVIPG
jgi:hypothetical protein